MHILLEKFSKKVYFVIVSKERERERVLFLKCLSNIKYTTIEMEENFTTVLRNEDTHKYFCAL